VPSGSASVGQEARVQELEAADSWNDALVDLLAQRSIDLTSDSGCSLTDVRTVVNLGLPTNCGRASKRAL